MGAEILYVLERKQKIPPLFRDPKWRHMSCQRTMHIRVNISNKGAMSLCLTNHNVPICLVRYVFRTQRQPNLQEYKITSQILSMRYSPPHLTLTSQCQTSRYTFMAGILLTEMLLREHLRFRRNLLH
jgi:hypothetical protein